MKHYRRIVWVLTGVLLLVAGTLVLQVYMNGVEAREHFRQEAKALLKEDAEIWVNKEFVKLDAPFSYSGNGVESKKSKHRRLFAAEGELVVEVDSVKESKLLFDSWITHTKAGFLSSENPSAIHVLNNLWQESLNAVRLHSVCAFEMHSEYPGTTKGKKYAVGDSAYIDDRYKLAEYYLDGTYFIKLSVYLNPPSWWQCADWTKPSVLLCAVLFALCLLAWLGMCIYAWIKEKPVRRFRSDPLVSYLAEGKYKLGEVIFDEKASTLTFADGISQNCPSQSCRLLSAFIEADRHFLTNDRIVEVCGWNADDEGVKDRKRVAISQLRKELDEPKSRVILKSEVNDEGRYGIRCLAQK